MKKKILIVGGCGFIGHNLSIYLDDKGYDVVILDSLGVNNLLNFTDGEIVNQKLYRSILNERINLLNAKGINLQIGDARDYHLYSKVYDHYSPDIVIHLAAVSHANKSNKDPHSTFDHSLRTLENTLDVCKNDGTHVIYLSSSMVYGNFTSGIVDEETECKPIGIYGTLKYSGELMIKAYSHVFNLPYTIVRPSALYGERCVSRRVGQIFIENLIDGIEKCCNNKKAINQIFNLTYGNSRPISDLIKILDKNFNDIKVLKKPREAFMPERGTLDISKAKELINFQPQNPIEIGYQKYVDWYKEFYKSL